MSLWNARWRADFPLESHQFWNCDSQTESGQHRSRKTWVHTWMGSSSNKFFDKSLGQVLSWRKGLTKKAGVLWRGVEPLRRAGGGDVGGVLWSGARAAAAELFLGNQEMSNMCKYVLQSCMQPEKNLHQANTFQRSPGKKP